MKDLAERIARQLEGMSGKRALLAAFDGVDTAGKTTLADRVHGILEARGRNSVRVSIDRFHNPREIRIARGEFSPEGFFFDSFDLDRIVALVLAPVKAGCGRLVDGIYDYRAASTVSGTGHDVSDDLIVLFDGIFLHRDELAGYWDWSVFLDVDFDTVLKRAVARDAALFGSVEEVERRYRARYIPGEQLYLDRCRPLERAILVIDNNDWADPRLVKGQLPD
jgi:uridine kinase